VSELGPLLRIAGPVVLAEIGWMAMGLVDTLYVGPLGPAAIAAVGVSSGVFTAIAIFGMGLMLGLDTLVSHAWGARRTDECLAWLRHGVTLALVVAPAAMVLAWIAAATMDAWHLNADIGRLARPYLRVIAVSALPLMLYATFRRYLQGIHAVGPVMAALLSANVVNAVANDVLIYGRFGLPALGVTGSAWATTLARIYMAGFLWLAIGRAHRRLGIAPVPVGLGRLPERLRRLLALGAPAAAQITLEVGVFTVATAMAARLDTAQAAAHQLALNIASVVFMVPLGLASSGAVRVGHAIGAGRVDRARRAGWTALGVGAAVMSALGLLLFLLPETWLRPFTTDAGVLAIGVRLLTVAAAFQLFDGAQAIATGILRGLGDTRTPMIVNVVGHWMLGLPVGYVLCFRAGWGVLGLWIGFLAGLSSVAVVLLATWVRRTR
jgi:MATE family multidrug resistance protein